MARQTRRPTGGMDAARGAAYTVQGNPLPYLVPPIAAIGNLIFAGVLSRMWGAYAHPTVWEVAWRSGLILACSAVIVWGTWGVGRARKLELRVASMLMSACSCAGLFVLTFRGFSFDSVTVYLLVMATTSVLLAVTKLLRGDGTDARANVFGELGEKVRELQEIGKTGKPKQIDGRVVTHTEMEHGSDFGALAKTEVRTAIASALDVPVGGVRMIRDRNTPRTGRMEVSPVDMLEHPPAWPGLSAPGGSIAEPLRIAVYQTGSVVPLILPGDENVGDAGRNAIGVLVALGQSGSGKTALQLALACEARSRVDAEVVYIDGRKGLQLPKAFRDAMHVFIHDAGEGERYLDGLVTEVAKRAGQIGGHGHDQWTRGCTKCPKFKVIIVDEASKFIDSDDTMVELAESVRSVGIYLQLGQQRATGDRLSTSVRSTIGGVICMGVRDVGEGARVLSEETIEAGADPSWKNRKPGALYAELPGTDPDDWSLPGRTYKIDRDEVVAELTAYLAATGQPATSAAAAAPAPARASAPAPRPARTPVDADDDGDLVPDTAGGSERDDDPDADRDTECAPPPIDPECPPDEDPYQPIEVPARRRISLELPPESGREFTREEIREMFRKAIVTGHSNGRRAVRHSDFAPIVGIVGEERLKAPAVSKLLKAFCQGPEPLLRRIEGNGVYEILLPEPQPALTGANA